MFDLCFTLLLVLCLHSCVQSKHTKHNVFDQNDWPRSDRSVGHSTQLKHTYHGHNVWNYFESSVRDSKLNLPSSTHFPPYYLSYDSGIKTSYQAIEEKLLDDQQRLDQERYRINQEYLASLSNHDSPGNARIKMSESQVKEQHEQQLQLESTETITTTTTEQAITTSAMPTPAPGRSVGRYGMNGAFGFMVGTHFYPCDKPKYFERDPYGQILPRNDYYYKCRYWDHDPRRHLQRKVGKLGRNGYFGYFENGRWIECPPPTYLDQDQADPNLFYIPLDLGYEPKCQYYGYNVSKLFDVSDNALTGDSALHLHYTGYWSFLLPLVWTITSFFV